MRLMTLGIIFSFLFPSIGFSEENAEKQSKDKLSALVLGHGVDRFKVGELLHKSDFDEPNAWAPQIQYRRDFPPPEIRFENNQLHAMMPGRGCTIWFREKIQGPVAIVYDVVSPTERTNMKGVQVRDINNFWMADGPEGAEDLLNGKKYTGYFGNYHKIKCYYASTGGGGARGNQTTRFRLYPREKNHRFHPHLHLKFRDGDPDYLIKPDKKHTIQLVACEDLVQYIVDGKVVYEFQNGDEVQVLTSKNGKRTLEDATYTTNDFPTYTEGYFGFRMVGTHHIYSNFRVYRLDPIDKT